MLDKSLVSKWPQASEIDSSVDGKVELKRFLLQFAIWSKRYAELLG